nr:ribonuclease H-like domain-containing protein [Tanacetum cinerariifolium]
MVAWFLGLEDVLSWLLVEGKRNAITVDINAITLFRQAIGSSPGRNDGTASPKSSWETHLVVVVNLEGSLPSSWSQLALIMRTRPGLDTLSFDDLYNNLRVFEHDVKGTTASSTTTQNMAFVSGKNTSSTNNVS